jgi:hypothetical protein
LDMLIALAIICNCLRFLRAEQHRSRMLIL